MTNVDHAEGLACVGVTMERPDGGLTDLAWPCGHKITQLNDRSDRRKMCSLFLSLSLSFPLHGQKIAYKTPIYRRWRHNIRHSQFYTTELYLYCLWPNPLKESSKQTRSPENALVYNGKLRDIATEVHLLMHASKNLGDTICEWFCKSIKQ